MNETAVKGHLAGVHVWACVCSCSLEVFCQFPENVKGPGAERVLLSLTTRSVGDKTHAHRPIMVQWVVIRAARRIHHTFHPEVLSNV